MTLHIQFPVPAIILIYRDSLPAAVPFLSAGLLVYLEGSSEKSVCSFHTQNTSTSHIIRSNFLFTLSKTTSCRVAPKHSWTAAPTNMCSQRMCKMNTTEISHLQERECSHINSESYLIHKRLWNYGKKPNSSADNHHLGEDVTRLSQKE